MASKVGGGVRPVTAGAVGCSQGLESPQDDPLELPRWLDTSCEDRREDLKFLGSELLPEAGGCLLLLRLDGAFREIAGGLGIDSGQLN